MKDEDSHNAEAENGDREEEAPEPPPDSSPDDAEIRYDELREQYLRALAEADNVRKMADRDRREAVKFGHSRLVRDLLPVHDSLTRALASADEEQRKSCAALIEGVELTLRELLSTLSRHGVDRVTPESGAPFDPARHQALFEIPSPDIDAGCVLEIMLDGFTLHDRLLRPAQVGVSSGAPAEEEPPIDAPTDEV